MRKIALAGCLMLAASVVHANALWDQIELGFVGHAKTAMEFTSKGTVQPQFLVNPVEIGHFNGGHIAALDFGVLGTILPGTGQFDGADWTTGGKLHLAPALRKYFVLAPEWQFLNTVEVDVRASYNWTQHHDFFGLNIAYPF